MALLIILGGPFETGHLVSWGRKRRWKMGFPSNPAESSKGKIQFLFIFDWNKVGVAQKWFLL